MRTYFVIIFYTYSCIQWRSHPDIWSCKCKFFCVYRPYKESITKEMNDDDLMGYSESRNQITNLISCVRLNPTLESTFAPSTRNCADE